MKHKRFLIIVIIISALLLVPFIAMQVSNEVVWSLSDFVLMGALLLGVGIAIEFILRIEASTKHRIILSAIILLIFFVVWAEIAVGIFGTPIAGS